MMNYYINGLRQFLREKKLDAIVVYANQSNDRYMKAVSGTYSVLQNYILITKKDNYISEARYLIEDLKKRTDLKLLSSDGEALCIYPIQKILGKGKRIGIVGDCKYKDIIILEPKKIIDISNSADQLLQSKSDEYIRNLRRYSQKLAKIMDRLRIQGGDKQKEIEKRIKRKVLKEGYDLAFPICITSGKDLLKSTSQLASKKKVKRQDIICIDMGIKTSIYNTDRTRMYFVNNKEARMIYHDIREIHNMIIQEYLESEITFLELINMYKKEAGRLPGVRKVLEEDFGHGIGFGLHEEPILETAQRKIGKNIVFTIEPTFVTKHGKMRIEDMVGILSDGKVLNLTR